MNYVVGFVFSKYGEKVLLIKKLKPKWQFGRYNGLGGKIEDGENPEQAMVREFKEECGIATLPEDWTLFCQYNWEDGLVNFYYLHDKDNSIFIDSKSTTLEDVFWIPVNKLREINTIYNLNWLIPLALDTSLSFGKSTLPINVTE